MQTMSLGYWGGSRAVRLPHNVLVQANLENSDKVDVDVKDGKIILMPSQEYSAEWIMEGVTPEAVHKEQFDSPLGQEVW